MELKNLVDLYSFGKPLRVLLYTEKPFRVASESYVVDGKLIDDNGNTICDDIAVIDYKHGYNMFMLEHDTDYLTVKIARAEALTHDEAETYDAKLAYYTELCNGDKKLAYRTMYDVEYCKRMGF